MKALAYDPSEDSFFVAVTWDEYRQLAGNYEIDSGGHDAEEVIQFYQNYLEVQTASESKDWSYCQEIMDMYGIGEMPELCLMIDRDLSYLAVQSYEYPFSHLWNGYSPWKKIEPVDIHDLNDLASLGCAEKERNCGAAASDKERMSEPVSELAKIENLLKYAKEISGGYNLLWSRKELTAQKLGTFCEYYAKMTLISHGISVYTAEVDDHGIDFVTESRKGFLKFQVKSTRASSQYIFMLKERFNIEDDALFLFLLLLVDGKHPDMYIIPTSAWRQESRVFVSHDYEGKQSKPDYGVNISKKNMPELEKYRLENMMSIF